ncbi:transposon Ty3-G Gag-Pol polyprotein [Nephila pilipes]|uniref:Transposon Ty3-G Gag-Pol polyprotein n=1 Tax=Nephila pilipes TaxID=299642 RepID=A0A8X6QA65_NEPPI|nr:transposon Ty3-G Gag-Pol polyprotein [Nephila pilipes]GFU10514.1 transposon Ty3-G Gag-Pol polyprotein [Nephila pilipes]
MKVGLQKKSQLLENRNKIWVKSASSTAEHENTVSSRNQQFSRKPFPRINNRGHDTKQQEVRPPVKCYGCGTSGFIRAKCPNCTAEPKTESSRFEFLEASSCFVTTASVSTVYLRINGIFGKACADTGSSHSIAGESLYTLLKDEGAKFRNGTMCISLAYGQRSTEDVLITTVTIEIEGRKFDQELIALPNAKRNRTLLGIDFLKKSGIMLDLRKQQWFFADMPQKQFAFGEHANNQHPVDNLDVNLCTLREEEGRCLNTTQKEKLVAVLKKDGPYVIMSRRSPTTYEISSLENPTTPLGALKAFEQGRSNAPILPIRKRGRPRKSVTAGSLSGRLWNQRGRM